MFGRSIFHLIQYRLIDVQSKIPTKLSTRGSFESLDEWIVSNILFFLSIWIYCMQFAHFGPSTTVRSRRNVNAGSVHYMYLYTHTVFYFGCGWLGRMVTCTKLINCWQNRDFYGYAKLVSINNAKWKTKCDDGRIGCVGEFVDCRYFDIFFFVNEIY